ncbi:MAG TPA: cytochrome c biogenesis protein CcsA [Polyangiaceae bacterium LLY-WYZ-14_1]|nr:cytochrome c biogenesis protein CcsA [Polyangiaceae bacterium LLY-WYZ-14_1]
MTVLFVVTGLLYAVACAQYLAFLGGGSASMGARANRVLTVAAGAHVAFLIGDFAFGDRVPFGDITQTLSVLALLIVAAYLVVETRWPIRVLGAFLTPVTLLLFVGGAVGRSVRPVSPEVRSALLPVHIGFNVLGIVAFSLAFVLAVAYVIQERLLRTKQVGGLFQRLPALDVLDSLSFRMVLIGFPMLTVGVITGTVWAVRLHPNEPAISTVQGFGLLAWLIFGGVLLLRVAAGWRGRKAAYGVMVGFALSLLVLLGYLVRSASGGGPA